MNTNSTRCIRIQSKYILYSDGRVWSDNKKRYLTGAKDSYGYRQVRVAGKLHLLHRLVATHFIPNPDNLPEINHLDYNRDNNDVSNLEWCSREGNLEYSKERRCSAQAKAYLFNNPDGISTSVFGLASFCKERGLDQAAMSDVHRGKRKSHKGWTKYEEHRLG